MTESEKDQNRKSMIWFKLRHQKRFQRYRPKEVELDMHDDPSLNRVYVTESHTLVMTSSKVKDSGIYFCRDMSAGVLPYMRKMMTEKDVTKLFEVDVHACIFRNERC